MGTITGGNFTQRYETLNIIFKKKQGPRRELIHMGKKTHEYLPKEIPRITKSKSPSKSLGNKTQNNNSLLVCNLKKTIKKTMKAATVTVGCLNVVPVS